MIVSFLALVGLTLILVRSTAAAPIRRLWPALFACSQCTGVWVGVAGRLGGIVETTHGIILSVLVVGATTSFLSMLADAILLKLLGDPDEKE